MSLYIMLFGDEIRTHHLTDKERIQYVLSHSRELYNSVVCTKLDLCWQFYFPCKSKVFTLKDFLHGYLDYY